MVSDICLLKDSPSENAIFQILKGLELKLDLDLETVMSIIQNVIPIYPSLGTETRRLLYRLVASSYLFLSQLVTFTKTVTTVEEVSKVYKLFIRDSLAMEDACFANAIEQFSRTKMQRQFLKTLFFGSRLFNLLSSEVNIIEYLELMQNQWEHIACLIREDSYSKDKMKFLAELLLAQLSLHPIYASDKIVDDLFLATDLNFNSITQILGNATSIDKQRILLKYVVPHLESKINDENYNCIFLILKKFSAFKYFDAKSLINIKSPQFQEIIIKNIPSSICNNITMALISKFAMVDETIDTQVCQLLAMLLTYALSDTQKLNVSHSTDFLNGVTKRLSNTEYEIRERTMCIAKLVSNNELKYESDFKIDLPDLALANDASIDLKLLHSPSSPEAVTEVLSLTNKINTLSFQDDSDSDNEDDYSDDIKHIVFIKDLAETYTNHGRGETINLIQLLRQTVKLVRQKRFFPLEVGYYANTLLTNVTTLNNSHEEDNFEQWRMNAIISIVVVVPEKVETLFKILFNSELSIQQRISILSSLGLAARELRGLDDSSVYKPEFDFPTKRLPWDQERNNDKKLVEDISDTTNNELISNGVTSWKSKKLQSTDGSNNPSKNNFRKYAPQFFYPLCYGWQNGIDMGTFDQLFKSHYINTLQIIYNCAYPVHDYESMTQQMELIMDSAAQQGIPLKQ